MQNELQAEMKIRSNVQLFHLVWLWLGKDVILDERIMELYKTVLLYLLKWQQKMAVGNKTVMHTTEIKALHFNLYIT